VLTFGVVFIGGVGQALGCLASGDPAAAEALGELGACAVVSTGGREDERCMWKVCYADESCAFAAFSPFAQVLRPIQVFPDEAEVVSRRV
jgi:hypothetical protein